MTKIPFTPGGNRLVYSNHPEAIQGTTLQGSGVYTIETTLTANHPFIHDFYHHNGSGSSIIIGVAVKNTTSSAIRLRVMKATTGTGASGSGKSISSDVHKRYHNSTSDQYISISGGATVFVPGAYATISAGKLLNGRVWLNATANGLKSRIVAIPTSTSVNSVFTLPRATNDGNSRTTALFTYDTRYANINMNQISDFKICGRNRPDWYINTNEFPEDASSSLAGTNSLTHGGSVPQYLCDGNYSVLYSFNLTNRTGKSLTIRPGYDTNGGWYAMNIGNGWVTQQVSSSGQSFNCTNISNFQFVLTGGNTGDIRFTIS